MGLHTSRRDFLKRTGLGGMALALSGCATARPGRAGRRPNFVVILTDDQAYRAIGYNNPVVQTPHLDALARDGVIFDRAYIATPISAASRASLLTGVFPQQHGSIALDREGFLASVVREKRYPTLAQTLADAGYETAFCGKSHLGPPRDYGFQHGDELKDPGDGETFEFATRFLEERQGKGTPVLLWVAARQPHIPLRPGDEWLALYRDVDIPLDPNFRESPPPGSLYNQGLPGETYYRDSGAVNNPENLPAGPPRTREQMREFIRSYYAVISRLDAQGGRLVDTLKATGYYENTIIVFLSDNGYHLGNHGLGNKITMHEESVRVPMFIHGPSLSRRGVRSESLVSSLDIYPTLLDLAGVPAPGHLEGRSLVPLFDAPNRRLRDVVASECAGVGAKPGMGHRMVRTNRWKYILTDTNGEALFDEEMDPYELENLAGNLRHKPTLKAMRRHMIQWMEQTGDTHPRPPSA